MKSQASRSFHGSVVPEPFRWLEDSADAQVQAWAEDQQRRTEDFLGRCAERSRCREFLAVSHPSLDPVWNCVRGTKRFRMARRPALPQPLLCVTDAGAEERALVDPNPDGKVIEAEFVAVSPSGRHVAFAQSAAGDVRRTMNIVDVATGRIVDASAVVTAVPMFAWLPDETGFFYTLFRQLFEDDGSGDARADGLYLHKLGGLWRDDLCIRLLNDGSVRMVFAVVPELTDCLLVGTHQFSSHSTTFSLHRLSAPLAPGVELLSPSYNAYLGCAHGELYFHTGIDAPLGRIVAVNPAQPHSSQWRVVIGAPEIALARPDRFPGPGKCAIAPAGLIVAFVEHAHNVLSFHRHDGTLQQQIELPFMCTVDAVEALDGNFRIVAQSFLVPRIEYLYLPLERRLVEVARVTLARFDLDRYELQQVFYPSFDGTRIPMYLLHRKELARHGNHPTLLYGYGGFGQSITPEYMPEIALWLELGGVYAVANLRGGGEYGEAWHKAASRDKKQVGFNDYYAAAEFLIAEGFTGAGKLGIRGISNGGLLTAVSANQRPDLFKAVISEIPLTDMLWLDETQTGRSIGAEYGNPCESPAMFAALRAYSPAHNVRGDGPAQLVVVATRDFNAPPGQAYKFVAARQAALAEAGRDTPVLLRLVEGEGHGGWREESTRSVLADEVAFLWHMVQGPARAPDLRAVDVPMRDGVRLCANVWLPARAARSCAVLLRTPYGNDAHEFARFGLQDYLCAGFAVVIQSVRGRGESQGAFGFFFVEGEDGYDSIEWIAAQSWCNGKVAMDGGSYLGTAQWLAARELPPHLECILPWVPAGDWFNEIPYVGGALQVDWAFSWLGLMAGLEFDFDAAGDRNLERFRPLKDAEKILGAKLPFYQEVLAHPTLDAFWRRCNGAPRTSAASTFRCSRRRGGSTATRQAPCFTGEASRAAKNCAISNNRRRNNSSSVPGDTANAISAEKFAWASGLRDRERLAYPFHAGEFLAPALARRRSRPRGARAPVHHRQLLLAGVRPLPARRGANPPLVLCAVAPANGALGGGGLSEERAHGAPDRYCYDPLDPVPYKAGAEDHGEIERRADVLVYSSEPMQAPLTVVGAVELLLHASSDALDTDFTAKLLDVHPDGRAVSFTHVGGIQRARYRYGFDQASC